MYPKKIKIEDKKLEKYLRDKSNLILEGREISEKIETLEKDMEDIDKQIQEEEKKVNIDDLDEKAKAIAEYVDKCIKDMEEVKKEIYERMKHNISNTDLYTKYEKAKKDKETLEEERNKIALKAQKYTDKIIPLGRKLMQPYLKDEYEDYETIRLENNDIVCTIFNHLEEFKTNFKNK